MADKAVKVAQSLADTVVKTALKSPQLAAQALTKTKSRRFRIVSLTSAAVVNNPGFQKFWGNAKVELAFPGPSEWPAVSKGFNQVLKSAKTGAFLNMPVRNAAKNFLVVIEVATFFYVGEIIGRGSIIGYNV
jgi:F-type H+-transporting ATPase subunit g